MSQCGCAVLVVCGVWIRSLEDCNPRRFNGPPTIVHIYDYYTEPNNKADFTGIDDASAAVVKKN